MTPVFADTFFYLALLSDEDAAHDRAVDALKTLELPTVTTTWVMAELGDALAKQRSRQRFSVFYRALRKNPRTTILPPSQARFDQAFELYAARRDKDWSLTDCTSFVVMQELGLTDALTGDRDFEQAGFRTLLR